MRVTVYLHTILQRQSPDGRVNQLQVELLKGSTLMELLAHLDVALESEDILLVVNGRTAPPDRILGQGDQVNLIPAISGG